jgi:bifunctional NMN adenylyltransferase/nudix hydrolase
MQLKDNSLRSYNYGAGVIVGRFQVHTLHQEQKKIIEYVGMNHNRVIVFIGVSRTPPTKRNPLDFMSRKAMIKQVLPEATVIPIQDNRSNKEWSETLDYNISMSLPANTKPLLYGGRDSFIPHYEGRFKTAEVVGDFHTHSGTASREEVSRNPPSFNSDFRAGVINSVYNRYSITYTTVDICAYNNEGQILLARKPSEDKFRFVGGFVDTDDESLEVAAKREFEEETGGAVMDLNYITSIRVNDWRYAREEDGIMTTLFNGKVLDVEKLTPKDDISELKWFYVDEFKNDKFMVDNLMSEHRNLMNKLLEL